MASRPKPKRPHQLAIIFHVAVLVLLHCNDIKPHCCKDIGSCITNYMNKSLGRSKDSGDTFWFCYIKVLAGRLRVPFSSRSCEACTPQIASSRKSLSAASENRAMIPGSNFLNFQVEMNRLVYLPFSHTLGFHAQPAPLQIVQTACDGKSNKALLSGTAASANTSRPFS